MTKYEALLRGVNVGGRTIKMAYLKTCFEAIGLEHVSTVLQSGNVLFEAAGTGPDRLKKRIEEALTDRFHYLARAQVYELDTLAQIVEACPFADTDPDFHVYVVFMENGLGRDLVAEQFKLEPGEQVQLGDNVVYWRCRKGNTLQSQFGRYLAAAKYRDFNTNRNLRTLRKLIKKLMKNRVSERLDELAYV
jgi:uncharacterized protein (DUF1697 family)